MLIKPSIDELEKINEDRYLLATLVSKRSRDLAVHKRALTEEECENTVSQATKELAEGLYTFKEDSQDAG